MHKRMHPILFIIPFVLGSCSTGGTLFKKSFSGCHTFFEMTIYNSNEDYTSSFESLISYYHKLFDATLSYKNINNVYTINNTNDPVKVDDKLYEALKLSDSYISLTEGVFNPYLGEITFAYKDAYKENKLPSEEIIKNGLNNLKDFKLEFDDTNKTVQRIGNAKIDLGGFAKGFIIDEVQAFIKDKKQDYYLLNGGLSSLYVTSKPNNEPFNVALDYLDHSYVKVKDSALSVSGTYRSDQYVEIDGNRYSHIINPMTGKPDATSDFVFLKGNQKSSLMDALSTVFILLKDDNEYKNFAKKFNLEYLVLKNHQLVSKSPNLEVLSY